MPGRGLLSYSNNNHLLSALPGDPSDPIICFREPSEELDGLKPYLKLPSRPPWLLRIHSDGIARQVLGNFVRTGEDYILVASTAVASGVLSALSIECQSCGRPFIVALDAGTANHNVISNRGKEREWRTLADIIRSHQLEYRDPPNVECCGEGATQTSTTRRVLEYWERIPETYTDPATGILCSRGHRDWTRDHSLEIEIPERE